MDLGWRRASRAAGWGVLALAALMAVPAQAAASGSEQAARLNNIGTALMNQQLLEKAEQKFAAAAGADPLLSAARLNQGIALLYLQKLPDAEAALKQASMQAPADPRVWYVMGLLYRSESHPQQAVEAFEKVVKLEPGSADGHYFLASLNFELGKPGEAVAEYQAALKISPVHASAEFGLARALQREGKADEARVAFARFQHLTREKLGAPLTHTYGEEGPLGRVEDASIAAAAVGAMIPVTFKEGWHSGAAAGGEHGGAGGAACLIQLDPAKAANALLVIGEGAEAAKLYLNRSTSGKPVLEAVPAEQTGLHVSGHGVGCAVGDYDNDGLPDLALATTEAVYLFRNSGGGKFEDVTRAAGLKTSNSPSSVLFVDYDHDGDLDLLVTGAVTHGSPNTLFRNNGDKTFTDWTAESGLGGVGATLAAMPSDVNNDRAIDLLVAGTGVAPTVYLNPREGAFPASPLYGADGVAPATSLATVDFNKDGWMDVAVTHAGAPGVSLWTNRAGSHFERVALPAMAGVTSGARVVPIDFDNDGWIDLVALVETAGGRGLRAFRNLGPGGFAEVTADLGLDKVDVGGATALLAADMDGDGATDLVLSDPAGVTRVLLNQGGSRNHSLRIALRGVADNRSAIGTKVEVFANGLWQKWEAVGQPEILAGLGPAESADLVRLLWPTGVPQDELDVAAAKPLLLTETDRRGSSCPTLFAWNGTGYGFVTDVIGAAVVGHWVSPAARNTPDADEWVKVEGSQLAARNGLLSLRFGEPMEEVNYVDQVRLVAVDHPAGTEVQPNEGFLSEPPFAEPAVILSAKAEPPAGAWDDHGRDVLALLRTTDHQYVRDFTNLPYAGFANQHTLTLELGRRGIEAGAGGRPMRLLLHGFVEYFSATSMYAAWQAGITPVPPYVEAQLADGTWKKIVGDMGFPAGLPRTIVVDLTGKLPRGSTRVRIVTNLQIYWDQALVDTTPGGRMSLGAKPGRELRVTQLPLASAELAFRGYPQQRDGRTPGDLTYEYSENSRTGPFVPQRGAYTRYGDVTPLLSAVDDRFVVFGTGEDMDLEFSAAALPPLPGGWSRDYFFYANGFVKDMDFYEAQPFTVDTLPFHAMSSYPYTAGEHYPDDQAHTAYQLEWNTRFESGATPRPYQFHYREQVQQPDVPGGGAP